MHLIISATFLSQFVCRPPKAKQQAFRMFEMDVKFCEVSTAFSTVALDLDKTGKNQAVTQSRWFAGQM